MSIRLIAMALFLGACAGGANSTGAERTAYVNALIFDGQRFSPGAIVVEGDRIVDAAPSSAQRQVDLAGGYVIPPFCEAHNHNLGFEHENDAAIARYLSEGIFYVGIMSNLPALTQPVRHTYNTPASVDVIFANGPLTATGGHPIRLREFLLDQGVYPGFTRETLPGQGYFIIDNEADLERLWPTILALQPDIIKIAILFSEDFARRRDDPAFFGNKGLDPALVPAIVRRAHEAGLRVFAHVETGHDFHVAVEAGVDVLAHMPGYGRPTRIDPADARRAGERGVRVVTTASLIEAPHRRQNRLAVREDQLVNLRTLIDAGVTLVAGSDEFTQTSSYEIAYLRGLDVFSNADLLRMWSTNCSTTLFPDRRLGSLAPGFEASFLVLAEDPLADLDATQHIALRVKDGRALTLPRATPAAD